MSELPGETGVTHLLVNGDYTHKVVESRWGDHEITQHFTGLTGQRPPAEKLSRTDAEWDDHRMVTGPAGHEPFEQRYMAESGRISGQMDNEFCESCPKRENCFVQEKQQFYSYGFYSYAAGEFTLLFLLFMLVFAVGFLLWVFWLGNELRGETGHSSNPSFWG